MSLNISLDMLYHPDLAKTWHYYQYTIFSLSTFMMVITIYIIWKKSTKEMGVYRMLLINELIWSYLFDVSLTFWQPVILLPFFMCYSTGSAQLLGPKGVYAMFIITFFFYVGLCQSIYVALFFRVSRLDRPNDPTDGIKRWAKIGVVTLVILEIVFFGKLQVGVVPLQNFF